MKRIFALCALLFALLPAAAMADYGLVDSLSLAPFVPLVLDALMSVAMAGYGFFVGNGTGIIYILVWGWLAMTICLYLIKLYFPKNWLELFGLSGDNRMWEGKLSGMAIGEDLLKPALRAVIAVVLFLQVRPQYLTNFIVDPFLRFGAIYTESISRDVFQGSPWGAAPRPPECPQEIIDKEYISPESCDFLIRPIADITHANNQVVKRGLDFFTKGLAGLMKIIPSFGGEPFLNIVTGLVLIFAFVASNFFMALLIIQGIFNFGMALIMYPFKVLMYVANPRNKDAWFDPWNVFDGIISSLKQLVITMIACMFIMAVNIAAIKALFRWDTSVFVAAAGGSAHSNIPTVAASGSIGFGQHSVTWLSAILTFYLMFKIFEWTKEQLAKYSNDGGDNKNMTELYDKVKGDAKSLKQNAGAWGKKAAQAMKWFKK